MTRKKLIISMVFNLLIVILGTLDFVLSFINDKFGMFLYFTDISNMLLLGVTITILVYQFKKNLEIPEVVMKIKYIATCMVSITLILALLIVIPMAGIELEGYVLFDWKDLLKYVFCPLLGIITFFAFDKITFEKKDELYAFLPTLAYGIIMVFLNLIKVVKGPYGFLNVIDNPLPVTIIWGIIILGFSYLICLLFNKIKVRNSKKKR